MKHLRKFKTVAQREQYFADTALPVYPYVHYIEQTNAVEYSGAEVDLPLYIENIEGATVSFGNTIQYSNDGENWNTFNKGTSLSFTSPNQRIYFRATGLTANSSSGIGGFTVSSGTCNVGGNVMSMLYGADYRGKTEITQDYAFRELFYNNSRIISARNLALPATALTKYCYSAMFYKCTSLVNAPELPAETLAEYCYSYMFSDCKSLVDAPELPAETLAEYCYNYMFSACTSLVNAPSSIGKNLAKYCCYFMFNSCTSLVNAPILPAMVVGYYSYRSMFSGCTSLVNAPELPATTLSEYCYNYMFNGCTSLVNAPELPATTLTRYCYNYMFNGCTSLVNTHKLPATTLSDNCYSYMFNGCTSLVDAPELPATTLADYCYSHMFNGCKSLSYIKAMMLTYPSTIYTNNWVQGVAAEGVFVKNANAAWDTIALYAIPAGWAVETATA